VDVFLENAQKIFDVARFDESTEPNDFALLIRPDGGLHFIMESSLSRLDTQLEEAAAAHGETHIAYRVTKSNRGEVRVIGRNGEQECLLTQRAPCKRGARFSAAELIRDQPLYWITSPLTLSASSLPAA
jgi:hypothetical protein